MTVLQFFRSQNGQYDIVWSGEIDKIGGKSLLEQELIYGMQ
ncbi:hypothetical protein [uncultured Draconibacterium sp.]|nr:hypothetical protein [uncultured Draconibacterium sp.]